MPKVLISDKMSPLAADIFKDRGVDVDVKPGMTPEELIACIGEYDGLAVRSATKATAEVLAAATNMKVIGRAGIGVDNIDVNEATGRGIVVMNTPFGNSITTAEHAIAMIMSLSRMIPQANESTRAGKWEKSKFMGVELMGKVLGIIGCGNIGAVVADRAQGLKMRVIAFDPYLSAERAEELGIEKVELDDMFARADFISLHTPLTDSTRGIIDAAAIAKMKPGVRIVNCARGGLIVEEDLKVGLENGQVAAAGLDVFASEPATENPLFDLENMVATPHLGASTTEAQEKVAEQVAEQMADYLMSGAVTNALNMPSVTAEEAPRLMPYMKLAEQLGSFIGQVTNTGPESVTIEYEGNVAELNTRPLTAIVLQGLLSPLLESVNMVSAPVIAKERDIDVSEVKHDRAGAYQTLIKLTVKSENQTRSIAGTLFAGAHPRIVEIKGIPMDAELGPNMLFITNKDKPGLIGGLGTTLGDAGINIATFHLGRAEQGGDAIALIEIDQEPDTEVMDAIRDLEQVKWLTALTF
ncbi:MAG: phosphoglycerate dehydrogenase [Rhodospirillaceae bacterium]|jgi:D-3-phosphoglycerate dehydrogenase / 2-oxoglutarate reductase|nr:phosphoglycerate dehydrogenase [Rhodospirillaceae bacterium]MBT4219068.1 phosphoglycerate dehydrogenase [Rhodospirillaceae bacterium]MBT4464242.1 phosphoglycerate dehydrogenase [Rhodospirillaceae bacterium]MBT5013786.1 phosphoglycerate dehydrogenase [Rhodospirillaceae bacterium]MBT5308993.1 phosphoglycerate dehydrogenase [Rhodospirillaceae bacterium]